MITKRNLVFLGPPGAGKGTLSDPLMKAEVLTHISTGDILRGEIRAGSDLGKTAKGYMDEGKLVPDQLVADMVANRLQADDCKNGFILDGFPRTVPQAELLDAALAKIGVGLDAVVLFNAPEELLLQRLTSRLTCKGCGISFNLLFGKPEKEGICDACGSELYQRSDDSLETAQNRLSVYREQTAPVASFYEAKNLLSVIDASLPKDRGYAALIEVLA